MELIEFVEIYLERCLVSFCCTFERIATGFSKSFRIFDGFFCSKLDFSLERGGGEGPLEKLILGLDRARPTLLGKQWVRVGKHFIANLFKKYSNPGLRYPTFDYNRNGGNIPEQGNVHVWIIKDVYVHTRRKENMIMWIRKNIDYWHSLVQTNILTEEELKVKKSFLYSNKFSLVS